MDDLDLRDLRLVQAIMAQGGVTAAAEVLNLTQSAVSHQLRTLEDRLQIRLFIRSGRRLLPTPASRALIEDGGPILDAAGQLSRTISRIRSGRDATIRLSTGCYTCYHWLPAVLAGLKPETGAPVIDFRVSPARGEIEDLLRGELDVLIDDIAAPPPGVFATPLFEDEVVAFMRTDHDLTHKDWLDPADLEGETLLVHSQKRSVFINTVLEPAGLRKFRVAELPVTEGLRECAAAGIGIAVMARWAGQPDLESGRLVAVPITRTGIRRTWSAFTAGPPEGVIAGMVTHLAGQAQRGAFLKA
jgi:LysR family transcriptional regulator for metE and metH